MTQQEFCFRSKLAIVLAAAFGFAACSDNSAAPGGGAGTPDDECPGVTDCAGVCDGDAQEATFFEDQDGDGLGNPAVSSDLCDTPPPEGFVTDNTDPDDDCQSNVITMPPMNI